MRGKFKSVAAGVFLAGVLLAGCAKHEEQKPKPLFEGTARQVNYQLETGKTIIIDEKGQPHDIEGFPGMFKGKLELARVPGEGYDIELLPLTEEEKAAQTPAPAGGAAPSSGSEYE